jgi:hypothetical protein
MTTVWKKGVINAPYADGGNVTFAAASGALPKMIYICSNDASNHAGTPWTKVNTPAEIFPPFIYGSITRIQKTSAVAEVSQIQMIGVGVETIYASTRYKIEGGNVNERHEGGNKPLSPFAYTSPAVLSGTAQTDLNNVYTVLVTKINSKVNKSFTAYLMYKVAFTVGTSTGNVRTLPVVGSTATSAAAAQTVKIAGCVVTSGTFYGDDAAGTMYVYAPAGTLTAASQIWTCTETDCLFTTAAIPVINGIAIVDTAGYYPAFPGIRHGISAWKLSDGFVTATAPAPASGTSAVSVYGKAGVYSVGDGTTLLAETGVFNPDKTDTVTGSAEMVTSAAFVAGKTYTRYDFFVNSNPPSNRVADQSANSNIVYTLYLDNVDTSNVTEFDTAIAGLTGVTPA